MEEYFDPEPPGMKSDVLIKLTEIPYIGDYFRKFLGGREMFILRFLGFRVGDFNFAKHIMECTNERSLEIMYMTFDDMKDIDEMYGYIPRYIIGRKYRKCLVDMTHGDDPLNRGRN